MVKTIILLRHGQYKRKPTEKLTKLGRHQALLAGKRLRDFKIQKVSVSSMPRALETWKISSSRLDRSYRAEVCDYLRECVPGFPKKMRKKHGYTDLKKLKKDKLQADRAFKKYFGFSKSNRTELLVCHGNIIRYLVCKSLDISTECWLKLDIKQCGITVIKLNSKNRTRTLISHNDVGHIPAEKQTFI